MYVCLHVCVCIWKDQKGERAVLCNVDMTVKRRRCPLQLTDSVTVIYFNCYIASQPCRYTSIYYTVNLLESNQCQVFKLCSKIWGCKCFTF
jgi:hypothetical protein